MPGPFLHADPVSTVGDSKRAIVFRDGSDVGVVGGFNAVPIPCILHDPPVGMFSLAATGKKKEVRRPSR